MKENKQGNRIPFGPSRKNIEEELRQLSRKNNAEIFDVDLRIGQEVTPTPPAPGPGPTLPSTYTGFVVSGLNPSPFVSFSNDLGETWTQTGSLSGTYVLGGFLASGPGGVGGAFSTVGVVWRATFGITRNWLFKSYDSGNTWEVIQLTTVGPASGNSATDNQGKWVLNKLVSSQDNLSSIQATSGLQTFENFVASDEMSGWRAVVGLPGTSVTSLANQTSVDGINFTPNSIPQLSFRPRDLKYAGQNRFVAVGDGGQVAYANGYDGAWVEVGQVATFANRLNSVAANRQNTIVAVGLNGQIVRSINNGTSWSDLGQVAATNLQAVVSNRSNVFLAFDQNGNVWRSVDSGTTWSLSGNISSNSVTTVFSAVEVF